MVSKGKILKINLKILQFFPQRMVGLLAPLAHWRVRAPWRFSLRGSARGTVAQTLCRSSVARARHADAPLRHHGPVYYGARAPFAQRHLHTEVGAGKIFFVNLQKKTNKFCMPKKFRSNKIQIVFH